MSILINKNTSVIVQGITGRDGSFHTQKMLQYGTNIVAGISPKKGGTQVGIVPVYNTVREALRNHIADTSIIFVPAPSVKEAIMEAAEAGIYQIICITEGAPTLDIIEARRYASIMGACLIGPNSPGIISPEESLVGIMPSNIFCKGKIGVISRSGTLTYEVVHNLTQNGYGQSTAIGIGGDPVIGLSFTDLLHRFEEDPETNAIVLIGEIGGDAEENSARYIKQNMSKPVIALIAGQSAPADKRMGHAGAIIMNGNGSAMEKKRYFEECGIKVALTPEEIPRILTMLI